MVKALVAASCPARTRAHGQNAVACLCFIHRGDAVSCGYLGSLSACLGSPVSWPEQQAAEPVKRVGALLALQLGYSPSCPILPVTGGTGQGTSPECLVHTHPLPGPSFWAWVRGSSTGCPDNTPWGRFPGSQPLSLPLTGWGKGEQGTGRYWGVLMTHMAVDRYYI